MLSGRYPSDDFAELRPRVTWDRVNGTVMARQGAKRVAIANAGTIPDRGLVRRVPVRRREGQGARRRARRGNGVRGARRRNVPARRLDVAHRSDHARSRARLAGSRRAGQDAVLEGRRPGPARSSSAWRSASWCAICASRSRADALATLAARSRPRRARQRQPAEVSRRATRRHRRRARRSHDPDRAVARRPRRLARRRADAARQPHPCAVGDGRHRARSATRPASTSR